MGNSQNSNPRDEAHEDEFDVILAPSTTDTPRGPARNAPGKSHTRVAILMAFSSLVGMVVAFAIAAAMWPQVVPEAAESGEADLSEASKSLPALAVLRSDAFINAMADGVIHLGQSSTQLKDTQFARGAAEGRALLSKGMGAHMNNFFGNQTGLSRMLSELELSGTEAGGIIELVERMFNPEIFELGLMTVHAAIEGVVPGVVTGMLKGGSLGDIEESVSDTVFGLLPHQDYIRELAEKTVPRELRDDAGQRTLRKQVLENRLKLVMDGAAQHTRTADGSAARRLFFENTPINWFSVGAPVVSSALGILLTTLMGRLPGKHQDATYGMWGVEGAAMVGDCLANIGYPAHVENFAPCIIDVLFFGAQAAFVFVNPSVTSVCDSASDALKLTMESQTENDLGGGVMKFPNVGTFQGENINLVLSSGVAGTYTAQDTASNGLFSIDSSCCTANVNLAASKEFLLRIGLVNDDGKPVIVDMLQWSFFDFDTSDSANGYTSLTIGGFSAYFLTPNSVLTVQNNGDGTKTFTSNAVGSQMNNVASAGNLTAEQASMGVSFVFVQTSMIQGVVSTGSAGGENIQMAGDVGGMCAQR